MQNARDISLYYNTMHQTVRFNTHLYHLHHLQLFREARRVAWDKTPRELQNTLIINLHLSPLAQEKAYFSIADTCI